LIADKKVWVEYTTAFKMINAFQKYVNSFGRDDGQINDFLDCDVLIIDDLGTEPIIKNVTLEHIYNVINERMVNKRAFIITTNLDPAALFERYDQRIAGRITAKENSTLIEFPDLKK
jgi:DNA replication protein DnaC